MDEVNPLLGDRTRSRAGSKAAIVEGASTEGAPRGQEWPQPWW